MRSSGETMKAISGKSELIVCQRCGRGFVLADTYLDLIYRRGARVVAPVLCPTCFIAKGPQPKQRGEIKWFSPRRRYGFIIAEAGEEVFFHRGQVLDDQHQRLRGGQAVRFHLCYPLKGPEALNVELVEA
jgi:CspA family cold shock protein